MSYEGLTLKELESELESAQIRLAGEQKTISKLKQLIEAEKSKKASVAA